MNNPADRDSAAQPLESNEAHAGFGQRPWLDRYSIQLPLLVLGTLAVQTLIAIAFFYFDRLDSSAGPTVMATQFCNVVAALIFREIRRLPGTRKFAFIFPSFVIPYSILLAVILVTRADYSIWIGAAGFFTGLALLGFFNAVLQVRTRQQLFVKRSPMVDILVADVPSATFTALVDHRALEELQSGTLIVDLREDLAPEWEREIARAVLRGIPVYHVKHAYESMTGRVRFDHLSENHFGSLLPTMSYVVLKRIVDFVASLLVLVVALVPMAIVSLIIRATSPGPAIFRQERIGYRGEPFEIYKFRTMVHQSEKVLTRDEQVVRNVTLHQDPRITPFGRFLRKSRLDELPQLLNVLRGDMSLIGPRPEARSLSEWYNRTLDFYDYRHIVKPGITGWAQVKLGHVTGINDTFLKTQYDFYYIKNLSGWIDFLIVLKTLEIMVRGRGAA